MCSMCFDRYRHIHRRKIHTVFKLTYIQQLCIVLICPCSLHFVDQHPGHISKEHVPETAMVGETDQHQSHCFGRDNLVISVSLSKGVVYYKKKGVFHEA